MVESSFPGKGEPGNGRSGMGLDGGLDLGGLSRSGAASGTLPQEEVLSALFWSTVLLLLPQTMASTFKVCSLRPALPLRNGDFAQHPSLPEETRVVRDGKVRWK